MIGMNVRKYKEEDKKAIQDICYHSGYMGDSAECFWRHKQSFVEIWTSYYINQEPESLYVATINNSVVGYLTGCIHTSSAPRLKDLMKQTIVKYGLFFRPKTAGFFARCLLDGIRMKQVAKGEFIDERWPSHLHINLLPVARGTGLGIALMKNWLEQLKQSGSPGCHLSTILENTRAVSFFEKMGFQKHSIPSLLPGIRGRGGEKLHLQIMVRDA